MRILTFLPLPLAAMAVLAADSSAPVVVSSASPYIAVAPDSLATIFGDKLATQTKSAAPPWPTSLGDLPVVWVTDSTSQARMAALSYVSPSQVNLWVPAGTAPGPATVSFPVTGLPPGVGAAALRIVPVTIRKIAPGLFSANGTGTGVAAASAVRIALPTQLQAPVPVFQCDGPGACSALPIDLGVDAPVYLSLYGTGIRGASSPANVVVKAGSIEIQPTYAGPQGELPGLDQINIPLSLSLRGAGLVSVTVTVDGVTSNAVQIRIP